MKQPEQSTSTLWVGIDVAKLHHDAFASVTGRSPRRRLRFANSRQGFNRLVAMIDEARRASEADDVTIGMEPSGIYWKPLFSFLECLGYETVLVHPSAVLHNRKTYPDGAHKTDRKDAECVWDLLRQGKHFIPVERDADQAVAYRMMKYYDDCRQRMDQIRNQLRCTLALAFPELNELFQDLTGMTALSFLEKNPTPRQIKALGPKRFLQRWRGRRGPMGKRYFEALYELAKSSIGVDDPTGSLAREIQTLAAEFRRALAAKEHWFEQAQALLSSRRDYEIVRSVPGIGPKLAVHLLSSIGRVENFRTGKQWVKLAGLDLRHHQSGQSARAPRISRKGDAGLRASLYYAALNSVKTEGPFRDLYLRRQQASPGRGSKPRALVAVADKLLRVLFAMLRDQKEYNPGHDSEVATAYPSHSLAA